MIKRRHFIKISSVALISLKASLLSPLKVFALPTWPINAFQKSDYDAALCELFGNRKILESDLIDIEMPPGAENGAIVPITVKTNLPDIQSISLLAEKNPIALLAQFSFSGQGRGNFLRSRIKLAKSSQVFVVVETDNGLFITKKHIEILKGGCD